MTEPLFPGLPLLDEGERECLRRYLDLLTERLGASLAEVAVYGSVARGESWPRGIPIRSDLDLLVVTDEPVPEDVQSELLDATLPLFLECGRQIGPQFRTRNQLERPPTEQGARFAREVRRDAIRVL